MIDYLSLTRTDWLNLADGYYRHLSDEFERLSSKDWKRQTSYLGWNACEVLLHMTSAIEINFNHLTKLALSNKPVPEPGFNFFLRNADEVKKGSKSNVSDTIKQFRIEQENFMNLMKNLSENEWMKPAWFFIGDVNIRALFLVQLSDNIMHERDLLIGPGYWKGFPSEYIAPLVDWFMREFRPAAFKKDTSEDLNLVVLHKLHGIGAGEWTMIIKDQNCYVEQGETSTPDIIIEADTEDLVAFSLARANPIWGKILRSLQWIVSVNKREDMVASITLYISMASAFYSKRIRVTGDKLKIKKMRNAFWHFGQRTLESEINIRNTSLLNF
jgi:hypothetical protein